MRPDIRWEISTVIGQTRTYYPVITQTRSIGQIKHPLAGTQCRIKSRSKTNGARKNITHKWCLKTAIISGRLNPNRNSSCGARCKNIADTNIITCPVDTYIKDP